MCVLFCRLYSNSFLPSFPRFLLFHNPSLMLMIRYRLHRKIAPRPFAFFNIFLVFALVPPMWSAIKSDRWNSMTMSSSKIPISLKIPENKKNYPWASRVWPWFEHVLLVFLINWLNSCARSDTFTQNNLSNGLMKNFTLPAIHSCLQG